MPSTSNSKSTQPPPTPAGNAENEWPPFPFQFAPLVYGTAPGQLDWPVLVEEVKHATRTRLAEHGIVYDSAVSTPSPVHLRLGLGMLFRDEVRHHQDGSKAIGNTLHAIVDAMVGETVVMNATRFGWGSCTCELDENGDHRYSICIMIPTQNPVNVQ
jgi:hypothetical protein